MCVYKIMHGRENKNYKYSRLIKLGGVIQILVMLDI